jgi:hypothetical protein
MIPQAIILFLFGVSLLLASHVHDKPKKGVHNFWVTFVSVLINFALLYWGGFFDKLW